MVADSVMFDSVCPSVSYQSTHYTSSARVFPVQRNIYTPFVMNWILSIILPRTAWEDREIESQKGRETHSIFPTFSCLLNPPLTPFRVCNLLYIHLVPSREFASPIIVLPSFPLSIVPTAFIRIAEFYFCF